MTATSRGNPGAGGPNGDHSGIQTAAAWTRKAITSFADSSPDLSVTEARLLPNQTDIGNAVKPFYGRAAGDELTTGRRSPNSWSSRSRTGYPVIA